MPFPIDDERNMGTAIVQAVFPSTKPIVRIVPGSNRDFLSRIIISVLKNGSVVRCDDYHCVLKKTE